MKIKNLVIGTLLSGVYSLQSCDNAANHTDNKKMDASTSAAATNDSMKTTMKSTGASAENGLMQSMSKMKDKSDTMKMTGDFDLNFANMMIMHHQGAIDMSEVEISKGTDAQIKAMAQKIIAAQKAEIEQMQDFVKKYKTPAKAETAPTHNELGAISMDMMDKMNKMQMTGNTDKDFAMMMTTHHESAVKMSESELTHGAQPELKKMAKMMIDDQKKEISEFKSWLDQAK